MNSLLPSTRLYVCGFPKSGLHLVDLWVSTLLEPEPGKNGHWFGTFDKNAWSLEQTNLELVEESITGIRPGYYAKGHLGWSPGTGELFRSNGIGLVFIYRDLRDVVVSQAYHVTSDDDQRLKHPGKDVYKALPSFEDVLIACIDGIGDYPGIFDRWELYAGWMLEDFVLKMRFEDLINNPKWQAERLTRYIYGKNLFKRAEEEVPLLMVQHGRETSKSPTFRKGKTGAWRKEFTSKVIEAFKRKDPGWLVKLGYVEDKDW